MSALEACTDNSEHAMLRTLAKRCVESLLAQGRHDIALELARRVSADYAALVSTATLRDIIDRRLNVTLNEETALLFAPTQATRPAFHKPATTENLFAAIYNNNDAETCYFLRNGVRIAWHLPHWRSLARKMFGRSDMRCSIDYLLNQHLVPRNLGLEFFMAAVDSKNTRLAEYLSQLEHIARELHSQPIDQRETLGARFFYWKCRNMADIGVDLQRLVAIEYTFSTGQLNDLEFVQLVRNIGLLKCCADDLVVYLRNSVVKRVHTTTDAAPAPAFTSDSFGPMLREITALMERHLSFSAQFVEEAHTMMSAYVEFTLPCLSSNTHQQQRPSQAAEEFALLMRRRAARAC